MKKVILSAISLILVMIMLVGCGGSEKPTDSTNNGGKETYIIKLAHEEAPGSFQDLYAKKFAEVLKENTNGKVDVEIFTIGQLGSDQDILQSLQTGVINMALTSPGTTGNLIPEAQFFNLHFLFSDDMEKNKEILNESKAINEMLTEVYAQKGIKVLAYWTEGFMNWTSNKPLKTLDDFSGFKMRTMQSPLIISSYKAYGANPTAVPFSDVYSSLQLNMIDGQENPIFYIEHNNLHEVQDYLTLSRHAIYVAATAINPDFYDSLPSDIQQAILDTVDEIRDYSFDMQREMNDSALDRMIESSGIEVIELTTEAREEFRQKSLPIRDEYVKQVGGIAEEIMKTLVQEIETIENK